LQIAAAPRATRLLESCRLRGQHRVQLVDPAQRARRRVSGLWRVHRLHQQFLVRVGRWFRRLRLQMRAVRRRQSKPAHVRRQTLWRVRVPRRRSALARTRKLVRSRRRLARSKLAPNRRKPAHSRPPAPVRSALRLRTSNRCSQALDLGRVERSARSSQRSKAAAGFKSRLSGYVRQSARSGASLEPLVQLLQRSGKRQAASRPSPFAPCSGVPAAFVKRSSWPRFSEARGESRPTPPDESDSDRARGLIRDRFTTTPARFRNAICVDRERTRSIPSPFSRMLGLRVTKGWPWQVGILLCSPPARGSGSMVTRSIRAARATHT